MRLLVLLLPAAAAAASTSWDCTTEQNGLNYDFTTLKGKHELFDVESTPPTVKNTTWLVDPCGPLQKLKDVEDNQQCPNGTYVCGLLYFNNNLTEIIPAAGNIDDSHKLDEKVSLFSDPERAGGSAKGIRVVLNGAKYGNYEQCTVIEFVCDMDRTGLEGSEAVKTRRRRDGAGDKDKEKEKEKPNGSLTFVRYAYSEEMKKKTLRLEWRTKQACEEYVRGGGDSGKDKSSSHWGFFTWVFILVFLSVAAYLIFASWLNYNRFNARGWDLLPHGDTIRELPFLLRDFVRHVGSTLQGRQGYSAV